MLKRWDGFTSFLGDGRICLTNNAAERALRGFALGRKALLFAGSDRGADRAAFMATLIMSAKLNDIDPQAWLADTSILDHQARAISPVELAATEIPTTSGCLACGPGRMVTSWRSG